MAKTKRASIIGRLENTASDVANALSVAATGSEIGILELAAEDEFVSRRSMKPTRKKKAARKKRRAIKKAGKPTRSKRATTRRKRA